MQSVKLNLIPGAVLPVVNVSQYDVKRTFQLAVYDGAASYDLTGKTVTIRGTKPDNHGFDYGTTDGVVSVSGNTVTISTTQQMTAVGGHVMAELRIESGTTVIGTLNFIIDVEPSALSDETIISDTEIPVIERDFEAALAEAEADALVAEGYAKGTQDGTPATSGQPYYHDNAKYYKEQANADRVEAAYNALKAEGFAVGEQNGAPVTSGSPYYHNNAAYYDGKAQTSATNAGNSESAAAGSASAAAADALEAEGFAVGEQNGVPVSSGSPYYQNNAKYYSGLSNPTALANMSDVDISSPSNNQVLKYNSTSQKWENGNGGGGGASSLDDLTDVTITTPASGQGLLYDGAEWVNADVIVPDELTDELRDAEVTTPKNLLPTPYKDGNVLTSYGVTYTVNANGTVSTTGTADVGHVSGFVLLRDIGSNLQWLNGKVISGCPDGSDATYFIAVVLLQSPWTVYTKQTTTGAIISGIPNDNSPIDILIRVQNGVNVSGKTFYPMLCTKEDWDKSHEYKPYYIPVKDAMFRREEQRVLGAKNLFNNTGITTVHNGVTFTINADKTVSVSGTVATGQTSATCVLGYTTLKAGDQIRISSDFYIANRCRLIIYKSPDYQTFEKVYDAHGDVVYTIPVDGSYQTYAQIRGEGYTVPSGCVFKPMIRLASDPDDTYVPYVMTNRQLTPRYKSMQITPNEYGLASISENPKNTKVLSIWSDSYYALMLASNSNNTDYYVKALIGTANTVAVVTDGRSLNVYMILIDV